MNTLRNSVKLIGRLGQDPEIRNLEKGSKMACLSLATSDTFTDKQGNRKEQTQWHNLVVWGNLATVCEKYLKKGKEIAVDGRIAYRNWENKNGSKHISADIVVTDLLFIGGK